MKRYLFIIAILVLLGTLKATTWNYDLGTGTGNHTSGTSNTFLPATETNGGSRYVRIGSTGGTINLENPGLSGLGTATEIRAVAPTTASVNKLSIYDYTPGKSFYTRFNVLFGTSNGSNTATSGTWSFWQGDGAIYSDVNAFNGNQAFTGIRWVYGSSGVLTASYRSGSSWTVFGTFVQGTVYTIEIFGNNTTASINYDYNGTTYSVAANTQDIWVDSNLVGNDFAKALLANDSNIDSFMFYGESSTGNVANIFLDDFTYRNDLPTVSLLSPPTLTADSSNNNVDNTIDITFTDDATWRSKITAVKIGGTALTATTDYVITAWNLQLKPSGGNSQLTTSGSKSVTVEATGYTTASVTQVINAGAPTSNSTASINSALAISTTRTVTCTAKDHYNNLVSGYTFKYDATITNNNLTTNESYTIDGSGITTSISDVSVTTATNSSGVATFTITIPATVDGGDGVSVQVQLNDGSTNIGSAFSYYSPLSAPIVTSLTATTIKATSAVLGGNVTSDGNSAILERGTVWNTSAGVTIENNKLPEGGTTTGIFTHTRTGLPPNTKIYYRAYARNAIGTTLSSTESSFTTLKAEPTNHVTGFAVGTPTLASLPVTWTDAAKVTPDGYLIKGSSTGFSSINSPSDGTAEANGTLVRNVAQGAQGYEFTGLDIQTTYYFKIFPYTNSGTGIDYKTDDPVPQVSGTTLALPPTYIVNFEGANETKAAYASGTVTLSGLQWNMTNSLIGTSESEIIAGLRTARFDGESDASMTMLQNKKTGAGTVSFSYRRYGTDSQVAWKVECSTNDGNSWAQIGSNFTATDAVQTFTATPNTSGNIRIRIIKATGSKAGSRLNIDDISISPYPVYDYPNGNPVTSDGVTVTFNTGDGNNSSTGTSTAPNPNFTATFKKVITLVGSGPWNITLSAPVGSVPWFAYRRGTTWTSYANTTGTVTIDVDAKKDAEIEIQGGSGQDPTLPVELSSFMATLTAQNTVSVMWVTQSETNVNGYYVYRGMCSDLQEASTVSPLIPATNTSQQQMYQFTDSEVFEPGTYYYWLQVQDLDGSIQFHGPTTVFYDNSGSGTPDIPKVTELKSVYPNPFNPSTTISYSLAKAATVDFVIYNNRGQIVRSFNEGNKGIGNHSFNWFGDDQNGRACSTGVYYIKMQAGKDSFIRKAVLMK